MMDTLATNFNARQAAVRLYWMQSRKGQFVRCLAWLRRQPVLLPHLEVKGDEHGGHDQHYEGVYAVPLQQIAGTEEQSPGVDGHFYPRGHSMQRWLAIAEARLCGRIMPPVALVCVNNRYYVRDGHHRISVAQALGEAFIDAEVVCINARQMA